MIKRLNRFAINLYPMAFRNRYGDEMKALIDDGPAGLGSLVSLLAGALEAHFRPQPGLVDELAADVRVRLGLSGVLACWVGFAAAGFGFYKTTEGHQYSVVGAQHTLIGTSHTLIQVLAALGSLAVIFGALPLAYTAVRRAIHERSRLTMLVCVPLVAAAIFTVVTGALVLIANSTDSRRVTTAGASAFIFWVVVGLVVGAICVVAARSALFEITVPRPTLKRSLWFASIATGGMIAIGIAVAFYSVALSAAAPHLADAMDGPLQTNSASISIDIQALLMLSCAALASVSTTRAWHAAR